MRFASFLCLWHMFCFGCRQFCPTSVWCRLWVLCLWWNRPFRLLSSSEQRLTNSWAMGGVDDSQSFKICYHWRRSFACWYPRAISSWENWRFLLKEKVSARLQEIFWKIRELCDVNSCRDVRNRPWVELFPPSNSVQWRRSCHHATVTLVAWWTPGEKLGDGRGDGGLQVGVSVVCARAETAGADFN